MDLRFSLPQSTAGTDFRPSLGRCSGPALRRHVVPRIDFFGIVSTYATYATHMLDAT